MAKQTSKTVRQQTTPLFVGRLKDAGSRLLIFVVRRVQPQWRQTEPHTYESMHYRLLFTPESEKKASMSALISSGLPVHIPRGPVHDTIFDDDHRFPNVTYVCHRIAIDQDDISQLSGRN